MNDVVSKRQFGDPLSDEERRQIKALEAMSDDDIDLSDMPEVLDWTGAVRGKYAGKQHIAAGSSRRVPLPESVATIYKAVKALEREFPKRKFTPDGHLVGSIGEVVAAKALGLTLYPMSQPGHDAYDAEGDVQIKMTSGRAVAMYATSVRLVVLQVVSPEEAEIVYDGPGGPAWAAAGKLQKNGQRVVSLAKLRALARTAAE